MLAISSQLQVLACDDEFISTSNCSAEHSIICFGIISHHEVATTVTSLKILEPCCFQIYHAKRNIKGYNTDCTRRLSIDS